MNLKCPSDFCAVHCTGSTQYTSFLYFRAVSETSIYVLNKEILKFLGLKFAVYNGESF